MDIIQYLCGAGASVNLRDKVVYVVLLLLLLLQLLVVVYCCLFFCCLLILLLLDVAKNFQVFISVVAYLVLLFAFTIERKNSIAYCL